MPDDERFGGTHSSAGDSHGYGRRHRRGEEQAEKPRRRRRSMEDGPGGLSVADLVQRHNNSRQNLRPVNPDVDRPPPVDPPPRRPAEGQPGRAVRRPGEAAGGPQWPDQYVDPPGHRASHALPEDFQFADDPSPPGRRALPDPPSYAPDPHGLPPGSGRRALPEPHGYQPEDLPPVQSMGRRAMPEDLHFPDRPGVDEGYGPAGHRAPDEPFGYPDDGYGSTDHLGGGRRPAPGQVSGSYPVPPPGQVSGSYPVPPPGGRGLPGRPPVPDFGFDPADGGFGPPPDNGYGHRPTDFGPGPAAPDNGYGPAGDFGAPGPADFGPGQGSGPHAAPANGFGPGQHTGSRPIPPGGFGPGQHTGSRPLPEGGFGAGPSRPIPEGGFGPGQGTGNRPIPPGGFGPGQHTGSRPIPEGGFGPSPSRPIPDFGPGQNTGSRPIPEGGFGPGVPPGHDSGPRAMPGQSSGGRGLPPGRRPMPGQASGQFPLPPPAGPPPGGPVPGDPMANEHPPRHPSGASPRDPSREERPPIPGSRASAEEGPGEPKAPLPPPRAASDAISLTTEMEAIGEEVQKRRGIDHTLARFSAVHDEIQAEERQRKAKRRRLMPWRQQEDELDQLDEMVAMQTIAVPQKTDDEPAEPRPAAAPAAFDDDPKTRRRKLTIRVFAATLAILVFVATGIAWGFKSWVDASAQQVDALDPNSDSIQDAASQRGDENFLLVGSDTRAGAEEEDNVGNEDQVLGARSDTVMIAHIPANRKRAVIVSFPRDLEISRPACEGWDPESGDYTGEQKPAEDQVKLNTAYQVGGPKCVTKLVQQITGLAINHFVGMDFNGFKGMVDAVEGVPICVERPLKDDILGTIVPTAGENVQLSGNEALNFVRARHVQGDVTADYGRIQRQQRFLSALMRKAMSSEVLLDPGKLSAFVDAFSKATFGDNIGVDQMVVLGQSLQGIEAGRVTFVTVPTVGEANDRGNEDLRVEDTNALMTAIRKDSPLPGEKSGAQQLKTGLELRQGGQVDPKTIKLQVFNGGNPTGGIAGDTADQLAGFGYQIVWVDAAPENVESTVIKYAKGREAQAKTLQTSVPDAELVEDPSLAGAVQLIIGPGFDGNIVAPGKGKPAAEPLPEDLSTINGGDVSCA